jgi:hypothetical protein
MAPSTNGCGAAMATASHRQGSPGAFRKRPACGEEQGVARGTNPIRGGELIRQAAGRQRCGEGAARRGAAELGERDDVRLPAHELARDGRGAPSATRTDIPGHDPHRVRTGANAGRG